MDETSIGWGESLLAPTDKVKATIGQPVLFIG
jgi:hypothetical protein